MDCSTAQGGKDCGECAQEFQRNGGCPIINSEQNLAPYFPPGCLSCVLEIGMQCVPTSEDEAPLQLPVGTDCDQCVNDFGGIEGCEVLLDGIGGPMARYNFSASCLSCSTPILESCSGGSFVGSEDTQELENFQCDELDPAGGVYQNCVRAFENHGGCGHMLSGENPMHWLDSACRGCVAEAGMHCILRTPPPQPMRSITDILQERGIKKIFVVGLVYDFCVSETAIFGMEGLGLWTNFQQGGETGVTRQMIMEEGNYGITVLTDLTRPSFDGKPGAPYTEGICDGPADPTTPSFCTEGGGTVPSFLNFKRDMEASGVRVARRADDECVHAPSV